MTQSPFLPGTSIQFALDSTSIGYFKTCPRLYFYTMIEGYSPPGESVHLRFGQELHKALQDYDVAVAAGEDHEPALHRVVAEAHARTVDFAPDPDTKAGKYKSRDALLRTIVNYLDHFRNDAAKTHILADGRAAVELSFRFELDYGPSEAQPYILCGHLDRVVNFDGDLYVSDIKTTMTTPGSYYFAQYDVHNQMSLYSLGGRVVLSAPIRGVIIDAVQMLVDSNHFQRGITLRTEDQLREWQADLSVTLQVMKAYAEAGHWPMNDTACGNYGGCRFRDVCSKSPSVRDVYLRKMEKKAPEDRWNPLKSR